MSDLGVTVDSHLRLSQHIEKITYKAHQRANLIHCCFASKQRDLLVTGYGFYYIVNFRGLARVAIQGLTWVNFRFLAYPVNSGRPEWSMVRTRGKLLMATAQVTRVSAGEL